jgi:hypothetical protein
MKVPAHPLTWKRLAGAGILALVLTFACACSGGFKTISTSVTFDNQSNVALCFTTFATPLFATADCADVEPSEKSMWRSDCYDNQALTIYLTLSDGSTNVYSKTATCDDWEGAKITIQELDGELAFTDDLPDSTPAP